MKVKGLILAGAMVLAGAAQGRVNVVTLPGRDSVQLTIYNSAEDRKSVV